ncbi:unnamed protein product [Chrysoparadoxa australica]
MSPFNASFTGAWTGCVFRQLWEKESSTFTYIVGDPATGDACILDPVDLTADRDVEILNQLGLRLKYAINTHCHADHITGTGLLKQKVEGVKSVISKQSGAKADLFVNHGDKLDVGGISLEFRSTPGHTDGCMSIVLTIGGDSTPKAVFTGDTMLVRGCGRTDFQQGDSRKLYQSVHSQLYTLPDTTAVYPAHDYKGRTSTTIAEEKAHNLRLALGKTEDEFVEIMANLNLSYPAKIDVAVPANLQCGIQD